jgi:hypothetical protein
MLDLASSSIATRLLCLRNETERGSVFVLSGLSHSFGELRCWRAE